MLSLRSICLLAILAFVAFSCSNESDGLSDEFRGWENYGGTKAMTRYSSLTEIDTANVGQLRPVWTYNSGDSDSLHGSQIQCNPIVVDGTLYGVNPAMKLFAVDAATGAEKWVFDVNTGTRFDANRTSFHIMINSRGIAHWSDEKGENARIFFTAGSRTYAIDAASGEPITSFGTDGYVDLHDGLDREVSDLFVVSTSPGVIYQDLLIMGMRVDEAPPAAPGHIRAYDVRTGEIRWIFHTIPHPGEPGYESWEDPDAWMYTGGANVWSGFSLDEERGMVFCGTGSATYDFYGGKRKGTNLYANCVLALDAATGEHRWHYQTIHHDLWDKDHPTPPALITLQRDGKSVDAVAQPTKNGLLFVLDRETGEPLFDVEEVPVPTDSDLAGEAPHSTQPVPIGPTPFSRQLLSADDLNPHLPDSSLAVVKEQFENARYDGPFTLPGTTPWIVFPDFDGGAEWGGPAFDPETGLFYVNGNNMARLVSMLPNPVEEVGEETKQVAGKRLYNKYCRSCHAGDRSGTGNNPSLLEVKDNYTAETFTAMVKSGRRMMPSFARLPAEEIEAIGVFVREQEEQYAEAYETEVEYDPASDPHYVPYRLSGYTKFLSPEGLPAISPPWGTLTAIDLTSGDHRWQLPLGQYPEYEEQGLPDLGTPNYGGPVVTAGGLVFIAATADGKFRAFNKYTGELLWEYDLPAPGFATPAVYEMDGKQYVVIACGGGKMGTPTSDAYMAFGL